MGRRTPRGGGRVRRRRTGPPLRNARRVHGHGRPRVDPSAQRPLRRQEVAPARPRAVRAGAAGGDRLRLLSGGRQRQALRGRRGLRAHHHKPRADAAAARAGRPDRAVAARPSPCSRCPATSARWRFPAGRAAPRFTPGRPTADRRSRRAATPPPPRSTPPASVTILAGQGARHAREELLGAGRASGRADGPDAEGEGGPGARQPLRARPDGHDRQPAPRARRSRRPICC